MFGNPHSIADFVRWSRLVETYGEAAAKMILEAEGIERAKREGLIPQPTLAAHSSRSGGQAPVSKGQQQENEILQTIGLLGLDPLRLKQPPGRPGDKSKVRNRLGIPCRLFVSKTTFDKAWDRLRADERIKSS